MSVEADLARIGDLLAANVEILQAGLNGAKSFFEGKYSKQWVLTGQQMMPPPNQGIAASDPYTIEIPVFHLPEVYRDVDWQPQVGGVMPTLNNDPSGPKIISFRYEDYPTAAQARDHYTNNMPLLSGLSDGQVRDINELVELPAELGTFYREWTNVQGAIGPMIGQIAGVEAIDSNLSWSGAGHDAYAVVKSTQSAAAQATNDGIAGVRDGVIDITSMSVTLAQLLAEIAKKQAETVSRWSQQIVSTALNPKNWLSAINTVIQQVQSDYSGHADTMSRGLNALKQSATANFNLDNVFLGMGRVLQQTGELRWPPPVMSGCWEPTHS